MSRSGDSAMLRVTELPKAQVHVLIPDSIRQGPDQKGSNAMDYRFVSLDWSARLPLMRLGLGAAAASALLFPHPASAKNITVAPGGPYPTLAAGVAAAVSGDTVKVRPGTYAGNV